MSFPLVTENDYGIRPAGPKDTCLYCQQTVGNEHGRECVVISKKVELTFKFKYQDKTYSLICKAIEPHSWSEEQIHFRYIEGSYCLDNLLEKDDTDFKIDRHHACSVAESKKALYSLSIDNGGCLCYAGIQLTDIKVIDDKPLVTER